MSDAQYEKPADAWGHLISEERQRGLVAMQAAWDVPDADHGEREAEDAARRAQALGM